jgi:DUF2934 family protein
MDQIEDPRELEREIERVGRLGSGVIDQTTYQRLKQFVEELRQRLQQRLAARRTKEAIRARARELWEQHGRPAGRNLEFWIQAEREPGEGGDEWTPRVPQNHRSAPTSDSGGFLRRRGIVWSEGGGRDVNI